MSGQGSGVSDQGPRGVKSLKDCSDAEIQLLVGKALAEIRSTPNQYGVITITVSGGRVKFLTVEKPIV